MACTNNPQNQTNVSSKSTDLIPSIEVKKVVPAFQHLLDSADIQGVLLIYDIAAKTYYSNDFNRCEKGCLPASTFKIPNSIIALETGVVESDSTLFKWDGEKRLFKVWEQDLIFRDAFHVSCVPCYQEIARKIGVERMNEYLQKLGYANGNMQVDSANIDLFWLEGNSKIAPFEQINFLSQFYNLQLPIKERTSSIMKRLMVIEENEDYKLSGKTGWVMNDNTNDIGWFVGYLEAKGKVYFFATNVTPNETFDMQLFPKIRRELTMKAFEALGLIAAK